MSRSPLRVGLVAAGLAAVATLASAQAPPLRMAVEMRPKHAVHGDEEAAMNDTLQKLQQFCAKNFPPTN